MLIRLDGRLQSLALCEDFLGVLLVLPEIGAGYLLFDGFEFAALSGSVKESSEVRGFGASILQILSSVLQSR